MRKGMPAINVHLLRGCCHALVRLTEQVAEPSGQRMGGDDSAPNFGTSREAHAREPLQYLHGLAYLFHVIVRQSGEA